MNEENTCETPQIEAAVAETERRKKLLKPGISPEMTIPDAVKIVRAEAAKNTGDLRSALTMLADAAERKGNQIGMSCGQNTILGWNVSEGLRVNVQADRTNEKCWQMVARYGDSIRMIGTIFGGRWTANTYVRLMRNAITAREKKIRRNHENRKAKKAAIAAANAEQGDMCHEV